MASRDESHRLVEGEGSDTPKSQSVRQLLTALERDLRERALVALGDFANLGLACEDRSLFLALTSLCQPSWGSWNGLLQELRRARQSRLGSGDAAIKARLGAARRLQALLDAMAHPAPPSLVDQARELARLCHQELPAQPNARHLVELSIALRNQISHGHHPHESPWWSEALRALSPVGDYLLSRRDPLGGEEPPAPWLYLEGGQLWSFSGLTRHREAVFLSRAGERAVSGSRGADILRAIEGLTGREAGQARAFRRLLGKLAPEAAKGVLLGDFLVGPVIGEGAFARVHSGVQLSTGHPVAVKLLRDGATADMRERFQREARYLSRCAHTQVVRVLGYGEAVWLPPREISLKDEPWYRELLREAPQKTYIAMERVEGPSLEEIIQAGPTERPPGQRLLSWFHHAAEALAAVHAQGVLHRDVKPTNLMVAEDGSLKLLDFGIARQSAPGGTQLTELGTRVGTPAYMAPEQLAPDRDEDSLDVAVDVYGLSATFYELASGQRLFEHDGQSTEAVVHRKLRGDRPPGLRQRDRTIDPDLEQLIMGGLEPSPGDRPRSMRALADDLRRVEEKLPIRFRRPTLRRRLVLGYRRHGGIVRLVGLFLLVAVLGLGMYIRDIRQARETAESERNRAELLRRRATAERERAETERRRAEAERERAEGHAAELRRQLDLVDKERQAKQAASQAATRAEADAAQKRVLLDASQADLQSALRLAERRATEALEASRLAEETARAERAAKIETETLLRENQRLLERNQRLLDEEKARNRELMQRVRLVAPPE